MPWGGKENEDDNRTDQQPPKFPALSRGPERAPGLFEVDPRSSRSVYSTADRQGEECYAFIKDAGNME